MAETGVLAAPPQPDEPSGPEPDEAALIPVLCYGLGPIGLGVADILAERPGVALTAAVDIDPAKIGADLGDLLGGPAAGVPVTGEAGAAPPRGVAVHATGSRLAEVEPQLTGLLERGWNVVSTCEELAYPVPSDQAVARRLNEVASRRGRTVLGAGINPGFLLDALVLVLSGICRSVRAVRVRRVVDTNARRIPLQRKAGVGLTAAEFGALVEANAIGHVGLRQSALMVADRLGWPVDSYQERIEPVLASAATQTGLGRMEAGLVIGQRQQAVVVSAGQEVVRYSLEMSAGAAAGDQIEIDGEPPLRQHLDGVNGDIGTAAIVANLVPVVAAARPGLLTMADVLPLRSVSSGGVNG